MGCGASAAQAEGAEGGPKAVKSVSSGDIDKAIATGRSGLVKNQRKSVSMLLSMVVINSVIRERIASEVGASAHVLFSSVCFKASDDARTTNTAAFFCSFLRYLTELHPCRVVYTHSLPC